MNLDVVLLDTGPAPVIIVSVEEAEILQQKLADAIIRAKRADKTGYWAAFRMPAEFQDQTMKVQTEVEFMVDVSPQSEGT